MIRNYFTIALRTFLKNRNYTLINILGLSIGITACIVIFLLITHELSFDKFHSKYENTYRIVREVESGSGNFGSATTPYPMTRAFRNDFPDLPLVTQIHFQHEVVLKIRDEKSKVEDVIFADSLFFEVFDFKVLSGNPRVELGEPGKVFLTESLAAKILKGEEDARIKIDKVDLEVVGIVADPPANSHITYSMIVSMPSFTGDFIGGFDFDEWGLTARGFTYVSLPDNLTKQSVESRLKPFVPKYFNKEDAKHVELRLQPLSNIRFEERYHLNMGTGAYTDVKDLSIMAVLGGFILCIACINFINLATASAEKKSKEIGIRKTLGAQRSQLAAYFLCETFLLTLISVGISLCATEWLLPHLNNLLEKRVSMELFSNKTLLFYLLVLMGITTFLAGYYPALVLSKFNPTSVLKNRFVTRRGSEVSVRKVLVVFQFLVAQVLLIGTLVISDQMRYARNRPLGFDKHAIVDVPIPNTKPELQESFRTRLEANPSILNVSFASGAPISDRDISTDFFLTEATEEAGEFSIGFIPVDRHYLTTYDIELVAGRWFTEADERLASIKLAFEDQKFTYILNETAVRRLGIQDPKEIIGKFVTTGFGGISTEVVGVVKDFHIASVHKEITPVVFTIIPSFYYSAGIKISSDKLPEAMAFIEDTWKEVYPDEYFEYEFLDEHLASLYKNDEKTFTLFKIFAGVSIFIGCLGLYGLISFVANQKQKEVGIRKVMGATVSSIVLLFTSDFVRLIIVAFLIAAPLTWYFMDQWLQGFAYRTSMSWSIFAIGFLATVTIVLMTILYRSIRAANMNPATTLRTE